VTFDSEAATIRGIKAERYEYLINIIISLATIVALKAVGIVMVAALLLIPAASAKMLSRNFKQMLPISITISICSTLIGIFASYFFNTPTGATIVITASLGFGISLMLSKLQHSQRP
jgi:zinc transport system permease protein